MLIILFDYVDYEISFFFKVSELNCVKSPLGGVPFSVERDSKQNFPTDRAFHNFRKQKYVNTLRLVFRGFIKNNLNRQQREYCTPWQVSSLGYVIIFLEKVLKLRLFKAARQHCVHS